MVFSSLSFLFCFFPAFLLVYYLTPSRPAGARNAVLLAGSSVFYIIGLDGQWAYLALLAASVLVNYGLGLAIVRDKPRAKLWLIVGLCYNFLWLFLFKYLNFLLTGVNGVLGWVSGGKAAVPLLGWALPVGISFYTFSAGGYLIDVYRGTVAPERSLLTFGTYLTMFPKLVSGPIASYAQLQPEFGTRDVSLRQTVDGLKLFVFGMAFKILLANQPTRGVDIGAIESIRNLISSATDSGAAVLLISADLDEILSLADRIIVLYEGRVNGEIMNDGNVDEMQLGLMMLGGKVNG